MGPHGASLERQRHRLAAVYIALSWREAREADRYLERAYDLRQWWRRTERERLRRAHRLHIARANQWRWRAVRQWLEVIHAPGSEVYGRLDEVMWNAATALIATGSIEARSVWPTQSRRRRRDGYGLMEQLLRDHPTSRYVGPALVALGEALRSQGRSVSAASAFAKVLRGPRTDLHARAHLGLGRCLLNVNRPAQALGHFTRAYRLSRGSPGRRAIRTALFGAWAVTGRSSRAHGFCLRVAQNNPARAQTLFLSLASWCRDHGRRGLAADLWQEALRRWPTDPRRCAWWEAALTGAAAQHDWHRADRLVRRAPSLLSGLARQRDTRAPVTARCRTLIEVGLRRLATQLHAKVIRHASLAMANVSRHAYAAYATLFPTTRHAYLLAAQHADLLWFMVESNLRSSGPTRLELAALFDRLTRRKRPSHMSLRKYRRHRAESALSAVRCWMKVTHFENHRPTSLRRGLAGARRCRRRTAGRCLAWGSPSLKRRHMPTDQRRLVRSLSRYLKFAEPKAQYRGAVLYNQGHLYWRYNHFSEALPILTTVAFSHARDLPYLARAAAYRAYHVLGALGKHTRAGRLLDRVLAHKLLMEDEAFSRRMRSLKIDALWARAQAHRRQQQWRRCGRTFRSIATRFTRARRAADACWQAARCFESAGRYGPAIGMLRRVAQVYRRSRHAPEATLKAARTYQRLAMLDRAARWYVRYVDRYPERKDAPAAHLIALRIRAGQGRPHVLATQVKSFCGRYGVTHPGLAAQARWLLIRSADARGWTWKLPALLHGWLKHHAKTGPLDRFLEASARLATLAWRRSCPVAMSAGRCLAAAVSPKPGRATRRPLLRRAARLTRIAARLIARAQKRWSDGQALSRIPASAPDRPARVHRARRFAARAAQLLAAMRRYRACRRSARCRRGSAAPRRTARKRPRRPGERWRRITSPAFRLRPAGFDRRPLRRSSTPKN